MGTFNQSLFSCGRASVKGVFDDSTMKLTSIIITVESGETLTVALPAQARTFTSSQTFSIPTAQRPAWSLVTNYHGVSGRIHLASGVGFGA
jgi:hypothetical protein